MFMVLLLWTRFEVERVSSGLELFRFPLNVDLVDFLMGSYALQLNMLVNWQRTLTKLNFSYLNDLLAAILRTNSGVSVPFSSDSTVFLSFFLDLSLASDALLFLLLLLSLRNKRI